MLKLPFIRTSSRMCRGLRPATEHIGTVRAAAISSFVGIGTCAMSTNAGVSLEQLASSSPAHTLVSRQPLRRFTVGLQCPWSLLSCQPPL